MTIYVLCCFKNCSMVRVHYLWKLILCFMTKSLLKKLFLLLYKKLWNYTMHADMNICPEVLRIRYLYQWHMTEDFWLVCEKMSKTGTKEYYMVISHTERSLCILIQPCKCYSALMSLREMTCHLFSYLCVLTSPSSGQCSGYNIMTKSPFTIFLDCSTSRCSLILTARRAFAMS